MACAMKTPRGPSCEYASVSTVTLPQKISIELLHYEQAADQLELTLARRDGRRSFLLVGLRCSVAMDVAWAMGGVIR